MAKNKQEDIFDAAIQLFAERGYDGTTIPMIAEKAKVGAGTIYRYFENKEALVNSLFTKSVLQLSELIKPTFQSTQIFVNSLAIHTTVYLNLQDKMQMLFFLRILTVIVIFSMNIVMKYSRILWVSLWT